MREVITVLMEIVGNILRVKDNHLIGWSADEGPQPRSGMIRDLVLLRVDDRKVLVVLLCGGDKGSQARDIKAAKLLAKAWSEPDD